MSISVTGGITTDTGNLPHCENAEDEARIVSRDIDRMSSPAPGGDAATEVDEIRLCLLVGLREGALLGLSSAVGDSGRPGRAVLTGVGVLSSKSSFA